MSLQRTGVLVALVAELARTLVATVGVDELHQIGELHIVPHVLMLLAESYRWSVDADGGRMSWRRCVVGRQHRCERQWRAAATAVVVVDIGGGVATLRHTRSIRVRIRMELDALAVGSEKVDNVFVVAVLLIVVVVVVVAGDNFVVIVQHDQVTIATLLMLCGQNIQTRRRATFWAQERSMCFFRSKQKIINIQQPKWCERLKHRRGGDSEDFRVACVVWSRQTVCVGIRCQFGWVFLWNIIVDRVGRKTKKSRHKQFKSRAEQLDT